VRDGLLDDPTFLPVIYAADKDDDWTQEATWYKANPALGSVITLDAFRSDCLEAQQSPAKQNAFLRYRLNIWTTSDTRWLDMDKWQECGEAFDTSILEGKRCWAGLDLSSTTDITSLALLFRIEGTYYVLSYNWVPDDTAYTRERKGEAPYDTWAKQGYLHTTSGNVIDYEFIRKTVNELAEVYNISEVAIDRWNASHLITLLQGDGLNVVPYGQGYGSMNAPAKELETLILSGKLRHNGNPVLTWFASNCTVETNAAGDIKPSKAKSTERIDGIVALTMALGRAIVDNSPEVPEETQYVQFI
jgi:phage terminase large subunit-like protein